VKGKTPPLNLQQDLSFKVMARQSVYKGNILGNMFGPSFKASALKANLKMAQSRITLVSESDSTCSNYFVCSQLLAFT
jgi:hypothetical protein